MRTDEAVVAVKVGAVSDVVGGVASVVNVRAATVTRPSGSTARTRNVCTPEVSPLRLYDDPQLVAAPASSWQVMVLVAPSADVSSGMETVGPVTAATGRITTPVPCHIARRIGLS